MLILKVTKFVKHGNKDCRIKNESKKWACCKDHFTVEFKNYKMNGRFVNLEPQFKIKYDRVKEHKKKHVIRKSIEKR